MPADLSKYTDLHVFAQAMPDRFYQMGLAERLLIVGRCRDGAHGQRLAKPRAPDHSVLPVQGFSSTSMKLIGTVPLLTTLCSTPAARL